MCRMRVSLSFFNGENFVTNVFPLPLVFFFFILIWIRTIIYVVTMMRRGKRTRKKERKLQIYSSVYIKKFHSVLCLPMKDINLYINNEYSVSNCIHFPIQCLLHVVKFLSNVIVSKIWQMRTNMYSCATCCYIYSISCVGVDFLFKINFDV